MSEENERSIFVAYLKKNKLKLTSERLQILEEVFERHDHFEADDLMTVLNKKNLSISRATVYRTLDILNQCGLISKDNFGGKSAIYEHIYGHKHHDHIICTDDGKIIEFYDERIEQLQNEIAGKHGIKLTHHVMQLYGTRKK